MPNRDTYRVVATVQDDYEDEPHWTLKAEDYLSPGQNHEELMAYHLREAAQKLDPESGEYRSDAAVHGALWEARRRARRQLGDAPATLAIVLDMLAAVAADLQVDHWPDALPSLDSAAP